MLPAVFGLRCRLFSVLRVSDVQLLAHRLTSPPNCGGAQGGIHPRSKYPVGVRLGKAAAVTVYGGAGAATGATLSGCSLSGTTLTVKFNQTLLSTDSIVVQPLNVTMSPFMVLTNASAFCVEPVVTCLIPNAKPCPPGNSTYVCSDGKVMPPGFLVESAPHHPIRVDPPAGSDAWIVDETVERLGGHGPPNPFDQWVQVPVGKGSTAGTVSVDLTGVNGTVVAIRYGFKGSGCCDGNGITEPCKIEQCPIMSAPSGFPANPFIAKISGGKCQCVAPAVCDE